MKSVYLSLSGLEFVALNWAFRRYYSAFFADYEDIAPLGYIEILKHKKDIEKISDEKTKFYKMVSWACYGFSRFLSDKDRQKPQGTVSFNDDLSDYGFDGGCLADELVDNKQFFSEDFNFLIDVCNSVLNNFSKRDRSLLCCYFFGGYLLSELKQKFAVNSAYIEQVVLSFRRLLFEKLVELGYFFENDRAILNLNEFSKKGKLPDMTICKLIKCSNIAPEEIAKILVMPVKRVESILNHKANNFKFYLWQIQKLRKIYFPQFTLQELAT